jgi:hypothetical protein
LATKHAEGTLRSHLVARGMVQQAERAFITGLNLVDLRMSSAKKR